MISILQPISVGNAIRIFLTPPTGAVYWRILRKGSDSFTGFNDPDALLVNECSEKTILDTSSLLNNVMAFYKVYYRLSNNTWQASATAFATPAATYLDQTTDVQSFVRDRLEAGLKVEVERGNLINDLGYIQVFTAPPAITQNMQFPLVSVHLDDESPSERGIGEDFGDDFDSVGGDIYESEGWLSSVTLSIVGWTLNPNTRIELRKALRRIIIANLPVFDDKGFIHIEFKTQDVDALSGEYNADIYQVMGTFSCMAPVRVGRNYSDAEQVRDVELSVNGVSDSPYSQYPILSTEPGDLIGLGFGLYLGV